MSSFLFNLFAIFTVACALGVVFNRNTMASALCLLMTLIGIAGLFVLLDAFFLAVIMVLVYAGAVAALFLFIVMLLDVRGGTRRPFGKATLLSGVISAGLLGVGLASFKVHSALVSADQVDGAVASGSLLRAYGEQLFTTYLLPVQIAGFLLLISMLGVVVLSKKLENQEDSK